MEIETKVIGPWPLPISSVRPPEVSGSSSDAVGLSMKELWAKITHAWRWLSWSLGPPDVSSSTPSPLRLIIKELRAKITQAWKKLIESLGPPNVLGSSPIPLGLIIKELQPKITGPWLMPKVPGSLQGCPPRRLPNCISGDYFFGLKIHMQEEGEEKGTLYYSGIICSVAWSKGL